MFTCVLCPCVEPDHPEQAAAWSFFSNMLLGHAHERGRTSMKLWYDLDLTCECIAMVSIEGEQNILALLTKRLLFTDKTK
jgi:hypothetical protein